MTACPAASRLRLASDRVISRAPIEAMREWIEDYFGEGAVVALRESGAGFCDGEGGDLRAVRVMVWRVVFPDLGRGAAMLARLTGSGAPGRITWRWRVRRVAVPQAELADGWWAALVRFDMEAV